MQVNWTGCWTLMDNSWKPHVQAVPGTYRLRVRADAGWRVVGRAGGDDSEGVLDIGTTKNLSNRLYTLRHAILNGRASHAAGIKFNIYDFKDVFPHDALRIEVVQLPTENHAEALELGLLEHYLYRFKDLPPLNSTAGNWKAVMKWIKGRGLNHRLPSKTLNLAPVMPPGVLLSYP